MLKSCNESSTQFLEKIWCWRYRNTLPLTILIQMAAGESTHSEDHKRIRTWLDNVTNIEEDGDDEWLDAEIDIGFGLDLINETPKQREQGIKLWNLWSKATKRSPLIKDIIIPEEAEKIRKNVGQGVNF